MYNSSQQKWRLGQPGNLLVSLIVILVISFCIFTFIHVAFALTGDDTQISNAKYYEHVFKWFVLSAQWQDLLTRPWTLLSYMFMHDDVFHMVGNLIWLWVFGFILQDLTGSKTIWPLFIYGGLSGAGLFLLTVNIFPGLQHIVQGGSLLGASAGVMAIAIATTVLTPSYRFFPMINGGIPLWVITIIYVIIDLAMIAKLDNAGGHIAHIGGGIFGWIFMLQLQKGKDWSLGMSRFFEKASKIFSPKENTPMPYTFSPNKHHKQAVNKANMSQKKIDAILDKIGAKGFESLTDEEKQLLKRAADDENL